MIYKPRTKANGGDYRSDDFYMLDAYTRLLSHIARMYGVKKYTIAKSVMQPINAQLIASGQMFMLDIGVPISKRE